MTDSYCKLVYDGGNEVIAPVEMGLARDDQLTGTVAEQLVELAARVCYDSLGKKNSRDTEGNLKHIVEVGHLSVLEHFNLRFDINNCDIETFVSMMDRPGIYYLKNGHPGFGNDAIPGINYPISFTANLRSIMEWDKYGKDDPFKSESDFIGYKLRHLASKVAPLLFTEEQPLYDEGPKANKPFLSIADEVTPRNSWVTMFIVGSRGMANELVRHGDNTAFSQRSTRFVDESKTPWTTHPHYENVDSDYITTLIRLSRTVYNEVVESVRYKIQGEGVNASVARKQAMGAARGYLGNALQTQLIMSASVAQWRHIILARANDHADAEIRKVAVSALERLKASRYASMVADMKLKKAVDGCGMVVYLGQT